MRRLFCLACLLLAFSAWAQEGSRRVIIRLSAEDPAAIVEAVNTLDKAGIVFTMERTLRPEDSPEMKSALAMVSWKNNELVAAVPDLPSVDVVDVTPQDMEVARDAGINVERTRIISIVMSTVLAGFGMIIYLQNMGNIATYSAHSQIGMFCIAALLVGGASVDRASIGNVFLGVILFHTMFIVAPKAGAAITGDSMIGEYFRVFVSYAVITLALIMYETNKRRAKSAAGQKLAQAQKEEEAAGKDGEA